jgi:hypothetical protein
VIRAQEVKAAAAMDVFRALEAAAAILAVEAYTVTATLPKQDLAITLLTNRP